MKFKLCTRQFATAAFYGVVLGCVVVGLTCTVILCVLDHKYIIAVTPTLLAVIIGSIIKRNMKIKY